MPTIIDELIVRLGLDPAEYKKGQQIVRDQQAKTEQSSQKFSATVTENSKKAASGVLKLRDAMLEMAAIFIGFEAVSALKNFAKETLATSNRIDLLSRNTGVGTRKLLEFQQAVRLNGGTAEQADSLMQGAANLAGRVNLGPGRNSPEAQAMAMYGGVTFGARKYDAMSVLMLEAQAIQNAYRTGGIDKASTLAADLGLSGLLTLFLQGAKGLQSQMSSQVSVSNLTQKQADAVHAFNQQMQQMGFELDQIGRDLEVFLLPALKKLSSWLDDLRKFFDKEGVKGIYEDYLSKPMLGGLRAAKAAAEYLPYNSQALKDYSYKVDAENGLPKGTMLGLMYDEKTPEDKHTFTYATSKKKAKGLMQIVPLTWAQYGKGDIENPYDNMDAAGRFMAALMKEYHGNVLAAVAHYNGGTIEGRTVAMGNIPNYMETLRYLQRYKALNHEMRTEVNINSLTVNSKATDAAGIAKDIHAKIRETAQQASFSIQADTGLD